MSVAISGRPRGASDEPFLPHGAGCEIYDSEEGFLERARANPGDIYFVVETSFTNPYDAGEHCPAAAHDIAIVASAPAADLARRVAPPENAGEVAPEDCDDSPIELGTTVGDCVAYDQYAVTTSHPYLAILFAMEVDSLKTRIFGFPEGQLPSLKAYAETHSRVGTICRGACIPEFPDCWCAVISVAERRIVWKSHLASDRKCSDPECDFERDKDSSYCFKRKRAS